MSFQVPTFEPKKFRAGDTLNFKRTFGDFPAGTWTLTYYLRGAKKIDFAATALNSDFSVTVLASVTATWPPGEYVWQAVVSSGSEKHTVASGSITILRNLGGVTDDNFDGRSDAKIALDNINALLKKTASRQQREYEIDGIRIADRNTAELLELQAHFQQVVAQEVSEMDIDSGRPGRKKILHRFTR